MIFGNIPDRDMTQGGEEILSEADVRHVDPMLQKDVLRVSHTTMCFSIRPR